MSLLTTKCLWHTAIPTSSTHATPTPSDDEIHSACTRRYRAAPEPAGNSMSM